MRVRLFVASVCLILVLATSYAIGQPPFIGAQSVPPAAIRSSVPPFVPADVFKFHLPYIARGQSQSAPQTDYSIAGLEVTQSVQDNVNGVPLVSGRPTVVRVYAQSNPAIATSVYVDLAGTRGGVALPGSPLRLGLAQVSASPSRGTYASSFNFLLPASWESGSVAFTASVDSTNLVPETSESNNTAAATLSFNLVPAFNLKIVPINYTDATTHVTYPGPAVDHMSDWIMRSYPLSAVNVSFRTPFAFSGDLTQGTDWNNLLNALTAAKTSDGAPASQDYVGLIPYDYYSGWGPPAWGGLGWISQRTAIVIYYASPPFAPDDEGQLAAHEIGHNFGLRHAPCGNPANPDPFYPYPGASVGQYGLDISQSRVWSPVSPDYALDVMSYCTPIWWSDYNYKKLYSDQIVHGSAPVRQSPQPGLMIRAQFEGNDLPTLLPVYSLPAMPTGAPVASTYAVQLLDTSGAVMASYPVSVDIAEEQGLAARSITAVVPLPAQPVASVRLIRAGSPVAERMLLATRAPVTAAAVTQTADALTVQWSAPQSSALVQYLFDDGSAPITLGVDVLGGELSVDPHTLPGGAGHVQVVLADGVSGATTLSRAPAAAVTLPQSAPSAWITGPATIGAGAPLLLFGHGANLEQGALSDLGWVVDGNSIAVGATLQVQNLAPGDHTVVLTVQDAQGSTAQATRRVTVTP